MMKKNEKNRHCFPIYLQSIVFTVHWQVGMLTCQTEVVDMFIINYSLTELLVGYRLIRCFQTTGGGVAKVGSSSKETGNIGVYDN